MLSAIDRNDCPQSIGIAVRNGWNPALRLSDVDLDAATVRVERSLEETKDGLRFKAPKTKHGKRTVALPPQRRRRAA